jgi:predicted 2-oxoglutarate/Fe(II)-dependent dioxygenase YbiX
VNVHVAGRWSLPPLSMGEFAPDFAAPTRMNPKYHFSTLGGRYVLLGFVPEAAEAAALAAFERVRPRFDDTNFCAFFVTPRRTFDDTPPDQTPGLRWFLDPASDVRARYGTEPGWFLLDPTLRVLDHAPLEAGQALFDRVASLPPPAEHAGTPLVAPVLIAPRVFEPELCRRLIDHYEAEGGQLSGVMRDIGGRTVGVFDGMKRRRDVSIADPGLRAELVDRLQRNLLPMIHRTFHFNATRLERYLVACYDAAEGGYFHPHRDNEALGTAHRRFAVSINLNSEDFEGGDLRFPEFGPRTYRPPTGGAVVFCCSLLHEATSVSRGRRYAFLPFLFDEAGEAIRQQNVDKLDLTPAPPDSR